MKASKHKILSLFLSFLVWTLGASRITEKSSRKRGYEYHVAPHFRSTFLAGMVASQHGLHVPSAGHNSKPLQVLLTKIYSGRPLNMITIGGSNSAGGGLEKTNQLFYNQFTDWWNNNIYSTTNSRLTSHTLAIGATASDFFSFCFQNYLPKEQPDIVLVELSVNDYGYKYGEAAKPMEMLTRRLLLLPSKPLVMFVHLVDHGVHGRDVSNPDCLNMEDLGFKHLATHYGIVSLSMREFICPLTIYGRRQKMRPEPNMFSTDGTYHVGFRAHALIASMLIDYFNKSFSDYKSYRINQGLQSNIGQGTLIKPLFLESDFELTEPACLSYLTPNWEIPLRQTLTATVIQCKDFIFVPPSKSIRQFVRQGAKRFDASAGWSSQSRNSFLQVQFEVPDKAFPSRSVAVILQHVPATTSVEMWLNDDRSSAVQINKDIRCNSTWLQTNTFPIASNVSPGTHTFNIVSLLDGKVMFSGLAIGYPGYHGYEGYRPLDVRYSVWSLRDYQKWRC